MRKLFAAVAGTAAALVLMLAPTATASAAPVVGGHGATVACGFCDVGW